MKEYLTKERSYTTSRIIKRRCDGCDCEMDNGVRCYDHEEFELMFETGSSYPDGGSAKGWKIEDLCHDCIEQLRFAVEQMGFTITEIDRDW